MCGISQEDTMHALVLCDFAKAIWKQSNLPIPNIVTNVFHIWFSNLLNVLNSNGILHATAILYHIWRARNGAAWDAVLLRPRKLLAMAAATMHAWCNARTTASTTPLPLADHPGAIGEPPPPPHEQITAAPPITAVPLPRNCQVDVGYLHDTGMETVGAVLLDANGEYVAAFSAPLPVCFSPLMAEAFVCKEAFVGGTPQIEVTFEVDANSILNVKAEDKLRPLKGLQPYMTTWARAGLKIQDMTT
ncbi:PREDICTED: uncharacterized protein LOC109172216 [Ipomoea nil]|uniref:uncharacterized protein LOC109172216 n=1 Tax=Ipomoea nil TaxID=35883 RepID=UPI0009009B81|nr:PREDICTED: uncharacterized protein LOC109172216 [Ipomoea nil]